MKIRCQNLDELQEVAKKIVNFAEGERIWIFEGQMGAGKTTLIKAICQVLGVTDTVQSPTYSIVNEYCTAKQETLYHFDFYRINSEEEAMDMGYEEYFYDHKYCFIEWASKIPDLVPPQHLKISIHLEDTYRIIELNKV